MPLYDYECDHCGSFRDWRSMSEAAAPADCPTCGYSAPRAISAPFIAGMNPHTRIAHQRNEKSADQPQMVTKTSHDHGACGQPSQGHAHDHGRHRHPHGPSRPWMIGH